MLRLFLLLCTIVPALADDITPDSFANRFNQNSLRLFITNVSIKQTQFFVNGQAMGDPIPAFARISYTIENASGMTLGMGLKAQGISAGPCHTVEHASGLDVYNDYTLLRIRTDRQFREMNMRLVPSGGRVSGTIEFNKFECRSADMQDYSAIPVNLTVVVSNGNNFVLVPLSADGHRTN